MRSPRSSESKLAEVPVIWLGVGGGALPGSCPEPSEKEKHFKEKNHITHENINEDVTRRMFFIFAILTLILLSLTVLISIYKLNDNTIQMYKVSN